MLTELGLVLLLALCNAFFALSEIALIASRKSRLKHMARSSAQAKIVNFATNLGALVVFFIIVGHFVFVVWVEFCQCVQHARIDANGQCQCEWQCRRQQQQ